MQPEWSSLEVPFFTEPPMRDLHPADQPQPEALRAVLEAWLSRHNHLLQKEVLAAWQGALERFQPDATLLAGLCEAALPVASAPASGQGETVLAKALDLLEDASGQGDLLKRLLDAANLFAERSALFIVKQGMASLYAHRGFEPDLPPATGAVAPPPDLQALIDGSTRALRQQGPSYTALLAALGAAPATDWAIYPLRHRKRGVALLMVDSGFLPNLTHPEQLRALVLATSGLLAALAPGREEPAGEARPEPAEHHPGGPAPVAPAAEVPPPAAALEPRIRAAAERLARVLVGDVELYFPTEVAEARSRGNLYGLLRNDLERSRATFVERFGEDTEIRYRIFTSTVIQHLCNGDASRLGPAPWA